MADTSHIDARPHTAGTALGAAKTIHHNHQPLSRTLALGGWGAPHLDLTSPRADLTPTALFPHYPAPLPHCTLISFFPANHPATQSLFDRLLVMTSGPLATATAALVLALALALGDLCAAAPAAPQCDMAAGPWIFVGNRGLSSRLFYATDLDTSGAFNMTFDIRHGPGVIPGRVSGNEVTVDLSPQCKGIISTNCNSINWTTPCMTDLWCRAWTDGCESPPPPYGQGFSFFSVFSSNMVLQQAPAQAAVYGIVVGNPTNVSVTVTGGGDSYTVQATVGPNATHQPFGPEFVGGESGYPGPFVTWKALLRPTEAGGNYTIYANCQGCTQSGVYENVTLYNVTFGDVWHCSELFFGGGG